MSFEEASTVPSARWSSRMALFSAGLLLVTLILHRFFTLPSPLAINLFVVGLAGTGLAILLALAAMVRIWITGYAGAGSAALGLIIGAAALGGPAGYGLVYHHLPWIYDVTTDTANPPEFANLAWRPPGANATAYPGRTFAEQQAKAYPDLRTLELDRSVEDAFDLAEEAVRRLRWSVVAEEPPSLGKSPTPGVIEATEQTLFLGFTDDIVIRIDGTGTHARIDARSASRYGSFDLGQNAARLRRLLAEIRARADVTPPTAVIAKEKSKTPGEKPGLFKRKKSVDPRKAGSRYGRAPAK
jgi:uncharacterized protein (DUF1499 family)